MALSKQQIKDLRHRCQTDLFFLSTAVLKKDLVETPHREMCEFFIKKNPDVPLVDLDPIKNRLLLCPRGSFKSSVDVLDCVQWIICYPDIRILILTAEKKLAEAFAEELRNYFTIVKDAATDFQILFPEFCVPDSKREPSTEFTTPARRNFKKEPTLWANSIGSNLPGWHTDVLKCDDTINNVNANEPEQIEKVIKAYNYARKLVDPGGYVDVVGTPYDPNDLYAFIQKNAEDLKVLHRPAWTVKADSKEKAPDELSEGDFDLYFPSRLTYSYLKKEQKMDPVTFESQYLLNAYAQSKQIFTKELLHSIILPWQSIPKDVSYYASWDLAYGQKIKSDYTAGFVAAVDSSGRLYILEGIRGRFSAVNLAYNIAEFMRRYPLQLTGIEDMLGGQWLDTDINEAAIKVGVQPRIHWLPVDRSKDAKMNRITRLQGLMEKKTLFISDGITNIDEIIEAFLDFTGSKNSHDDVPDAISFFPRFVPMQPQGAEFNKASWAQLQNDCLRELIFPTSVPVPVYEAYSEPEPDPILYF